MVMRYEGLIPGGQQWSIPLVTYRALVIQVGVTLEAFASPLNSRLLLLRSELSRDDLWYCSLFPEDTPFGSLGSYFRASYPPDAETAILVNPPFVERIIQRALLHTLKILAAAPNLLCIMVVPTWTDAQFYITLKKAAHTVIPLYGKHHFYEDNEQPVITGAGTTIFALGRPISSITLRSCFDTMLVE
jgi:hypothetical protein